MLQTYGAGDILFTQSIAQDYIDQGNTVIWPVESVYVPLAKHFPNISIIDKSLMNIDYGLASAIDIGGTSIVPICYSIPVLNVPAADCMRSKYWLLGKNWELWKNNCKIIRDYTAEQKLYSNILGIEPDEQYNLISENFRIGGMKSRPIQVDNGLRNIYMSIIPEFTLIDWLLVMQRATTIHAVASSNVYLFELFPMKAHSLNQIYLYIRRPDEQNHKNYDYILSPSGYTLMD